ncbi:MAG: alpha/beta hydrolase [Nocardioides sp.]
MTHRLEVRSARAAHRRSDTPLLFVHGAWLGSWVWDEQVLPYVAAQGYDAYAVVSLRGHGAATGRHAGGPQYTDYVRDVALVAGELGPGTVADRLLHGWLRGAEVPRGPPPAGGGIGRFGPAHRGAPADAAHRPDPTRDFLEPPATLSLYPLVEDPAQVHALMFTPELDPATAASYQRRLQDESYLAFLDMLALDLVRPRQITPGPLLVVRAQRDELFPEPAVRATAAAYGTTAVSIPGRPRPHAGDPLASAGTLLDWLRPRVG